jgi:hypothetical protein
MDMANSLAIRQITPKSRAGFQSPGAEIVAVFLDAGLHHPVQSTPAQGDEAQHDVGNNAGGQPGRLAPAHHPIGLSEDQQHEGGHDDRDAEPEAKPKE